MYGSSVTAIDLKGTPAADLRGNAVTMFDRMAQAMPR